MTCAVCGAEATHFCTGCGKYLCDSMRCATIAGASAVVSNPLAAARAAPAAIAYQGANVGRKITSVARTVVDALSFKP